MLKSDLQWTLYSRYLAQVQSLTGSWIDSRRLGEILLSQPDGTEILDDDDLKLPISVETSYFLDLTTGI